MSTLSILNDLITICKDGEQGFTKVSEEVQVQNLKELFSRRAMACSIAADELQKHVKDMGEEPADSGSFLGMLHRGWISMKSALTDRDTYDIIKECEEGEDAAKEAYLKALEADLPEDIRNVIQRQYEGVEENLDKVRNLLDEYNEAE